MSERYLYHGMDITLDVYEAIGEAVAMIAGREGVSFEEAYRLFADSGVYEALQDAETMMWSESPEFMVAEYYRRGSQVV